MSEPTTPRSARIVPSSMDTLKSLASTFSTFTPLDVRSVEDQESVAGDLDESHVQSGTRVSQTPNEMGGQGAQGNKRSTPVNRPQTEQRKPSVIKTESKSGGQNTPIGSRKGDKVKKIDDTYLLSGECVSKTHKVFTAVGSIEELIALLGRIKARYFNTGKSSEVNAATSKKLFFFARMTQIQEALNSLQKSLLTTTYNNAKYIRSRFSDEYTKELDKEMKGIFGEPGPVHILPGTTELEADLMICRAVVRRVERQVIAVKDPKSGFVPDISAIEYLGKLDKYIFSLATYILNMSMKMPLKLSKEA